MKELLFSPEANDQLTQLEADRALTQLFDRINDILDTIEENPGDAEVRRRRYGVTREVLWGVPVHGSGEDRIILWSETADGPLIHYIGPDPR